jgi:hypothetical protein
MSVQNRESLDAVTLAEFERMWAFMRTFLRQEHNDDGTHPFGEWQPYTVQWEGGPIADAQPSIGDGRLTGKYTRIGNTVTVSIHLYVGATTDPGAVSNTWLFSLPFPVLHTEFPLYFGVASKHGMLAHALFRGTQVYAYDFNGNWGSSDPFASGFSDNLWITGTYEAAPQ